MSTRELLKTLNINKAGHYDNQFYIVELEDSNDYARMYTNLNEHAVNTEYPNFAVNSNNTTVKATNYFELDTGDETYNIFLIADFENEKYYIKIGEK